MNVQAKWEELNSKSRKLLQSLTKGISTYWPAILAIFTIAVLAAVVVLLILHLVFGMQWADWTGLGEYTGPLTKDQRGKTLWDWLGLLIIPVVLALGAIWFNKSEKKNEQILATDRQRESALQNYIDKLTELLLNQDTPLRKSQPDDEVRAVGRARTLATLRTLDPGRKGMLLQFLSEADLITSTDPIIELRKADLSGADLSGADLGRAALHRANMNGATLSGADLSGADLSEANLCGADLFAVDLSGANLSEAFLIRADLNGATLSRADLSKAELNGADMSWGTLDGANLAKADLSEADLTSANLTEADLTGATLCEANLTRVNLAKANLTGANLAEANLSEAQVTEAQLASAKNLALATMPDGIKHA